VSEPTAHFVRALPLSELQPGSMAGVELEGTKVLLSNLDGEVHAVSGVCTHEDYDLSQGFILEGAVVCTLHLSQFDLKTGEVYNPPATLPLRVFNIKIEEDIIFVEV
jgi:3-phenylpropionate/trans-cinnamate dioxygenase ferredoxin component